MTPHSYEPRRDSSLRSEFTQIAGVHKSGGAARKSARATNAGSDQFHELGSSESPRHTRELRRDNQRGVTLIEMLVVVIVIALVVAISTPSVTAGIDSVRLATATSSVAAFLNAASTRAERRQQPVEVIISGGSLRFVSTQPGSARELTLPDGISVHRFSAQPLDNLQSPTNVLFLPGGAVPAVALEVTNQHGARRVIRLDPMTGYPRVITGTSNETGNENQ